jgi:hypothetical protein
MNKEELTIALLQRTNKEMIEAHFKNNGLTSDKDKIPFILGYVITKTMDILEEQGIITNE